MRQRLAYVLLMLVVAMGAGIYLSFFSQLNADAAVASVTLSDPDTTHYGLDGWDFNIAYTVSGDAPDGFTGFEFYVFTSQFLTDNVVNAGNVKTTGCNGLACKDFGFMYGHQTGNFMLPPFEKQDSLQSDFIANTAYKACVRMLATSSTLTCSTAVTPTNDTSGITDLGIPQIDFVEVPTVVAAANQFMHAFVYDNQVTAVQFDDTTDGQPEFVRLMYAQNDINNAKTTVNGVLVAGDLFKFDVSGLTAGNTYKYYLVVQDRNNNRGFYCGTGYATATSTCLANPLTFQVVASAGLSTVTGSGVVNEIDISAGTLGASRNPTVFLAGSSLASVIGSSTGTFSFSNVPAGGKTYEVVAYKAGRCPVEFFKPNVTANFFVTLELGTFACGYVEQPTGGGPGGGGFAGGLDPMVVGSFPFPNSNGFPASENLKIFFDQPMSTSTISDNDASNADSAIYLTASTASNKIAGKVYYCQNNASAPSNVCSLLTAFDKNVGVFDPTSDLSQNKNYTLVVTNAVKNVGGKSVLVNTPGIGEVIPFFTGGTAINFSDPGVTFGGSGQYMPPYVQSMTPGPGQQAPRNVKLFLEFNDPMDSATITASTIKLYKMSNGTGTQVTLANADISLDTNEKRFVTITPPTQLDASSEYELRVYGKAKSTAGVTLMPGNVNDGPKNASKGEDTNSGVISFVGFFTTSASSDSTAATIYPNVANNGTIPVNEGIRFGFSEAMSQGSIKASNFIFKRGTAAVDKKVYYLADKQEAVIVPNTALASGQTYTLQFTKNVTDQQGIAIATTTYTYTAGSPDSTAPKVVESRCDDYTCAITFNEIMNNEPQLGTNYAGSVLNHANFILTQNNGPDLIGANTVIKYDPVESIVTFDGISLTYNVSSAQTYSLVVATTLKDLSDNAIATTTLTGNVEDSKQTFGEFGGGGMFGPPTQFFETTPGGPTGSFQSGAGPFKSSGFGEFTADQFAFGSADFANPMNPTAGVDSGLFFIDFHPGQAVQNGDKVEILFPDGTTFGTVGFDTNSPLYKDMNESWHPGVVTTTAATTTAGTTKVVLTLGVKTQNGLPGTNDPLKIDLKGIINPKIPKDPSSGSGYTVTLKLVRAGSTLATKTSMPFFVMKAGSNSITVEVKAGSATTPDNVSGTIFLFGGGPSGMLDKQLTVTAGAVSTTFSSLNDGCYFFGTDPFVTLGSNDYFGQMTPEPVCVSGSQNSEKVIVLSSAATSGSGSAALRVRVTQSDGSTLFNFGGADIDIFAGGPNKFVVKTLSSATTVSTTIPINATGFWFVGVGPAMPKGSSGGKPKALTAVLPPPADINVSSVASTLATFTAGFNVPKGVVIDATNSRITYKVATANKTISGTVKDGSGTALQNVEVFMHSQGFGATSFTQTNASGTFSLSVSECGPYEIGAFQEGLPPTFSPIELIDCSSTMRVKYKGQTVTASAVNLVMKKPSYSISGKVLDISNNAVAYAPIFASDGEGGFSGAMTDQSGNYTLFVDNGTWTVRVELPPDKSDVCGTWSKTITIAGESKSSQNITQSGTTECATISGTLTVDGSAKASVPLFVEEWNEASSTPVVGGFARGSGTDSSGAYSVKVPKKSAIFRVGSWDPGFGELSATGTMTADSSSVTINLTTGNRGTVQFTFKGGTASMDAFVEIKNTSDFNKRFGKSVNGLNSAQSVQMPEGNYNYFVNVFGVGEFKNSTSTPIAVTAGHTTQVTINLNLGTKTFITATGTVKDASGNALSGAVVTLKDPTTGKTTTASTDSTGVWSAEVKDGSYEVSASLAGYVPSIASTTATFAATGTTTFNFDAAHSAALNVATKIVTGTIYSSSSTLTAISDGFVTAKNSAGVSISTAVDPATGEYSLPLTNGTWTMSAVAPLHDRTSTSTITLSGAGTSTVQSHDIKLTADAAAVPAATSEAISASTGGSLNDLSDTGVKLICGAGVLEATSGDVTVTVEKTFTAPETANYDPLGDAAFEISATGNSTIKDLNGNVEIQISYDDLLSHLPAGVSETELALVYFDTKSGEYVPVEGGYVIDKENNIITGMVDHFTQFAVVVSAGGGSSSSQSSPSASPSSPSQSGGSVIGGGGGSSASKTPPTLPKTVTSTPQQTLTQTYVLNTATPLSIGGMTHTVTVTGAADDQVTFTIASEPIKLTMAKNESKVLDTNGDKVNDLSVTYLGFKDNTPSFLFKNLTDANEVKNAVVVNYGAYQTDSPNVVLKLNATGAVSYAVSNSSNFTSKTTFFQYAPTTTWALSPGNGKKTIYVRFKSVDGGTIDASDTIELTGQAFEQAKEEVKPVENISDVECSLITGGAYKSADSPAVYYITEKCEKRPFRAPDRFFSYFTSWKDVMTVPAADLEAIADDTLGFMPWGPKYDPKYGALVKSVTDPKVYALLGGQKQWVVSEAVLTGLKWTFKWIEDVSQSFLDKYNAGSDITKTDYHPNYTIIKYPESSNVYRLEPDPNDPGKQLKRHIETEDAFKKEQLRWDRIITVPDTEVYEDGEPIQ